MKRDTTSVHKDEAKSMFCPMKRTSFFVNLDDNIVAPPNNSFINPDGEEVVSTCEGAKCMMWRFIDDPESDEGFCGLAYPR